EILDWYDGYTWDGKTRVLNPISILSFFDKQIFKPYWNLTSPSNTFLNNLITANPLSFTNTNLQGYSESDISLATVGNITSVPLLFHSGYLTIDKITRVDKDLQYSFRVPNYEVKKPFYDILNKCLLIENSLTEAAELNQALRERDGQLLTKIIQKLFSRIPAEHYEKNEELKESFFHMFLLSYCSGLLPEVRPEPPGPLGDADLILITASGLRAVLEVKFAPSAAPAKLEATLNKLANQGLKAIKEKKYGETDRLKGYDFAIIGVGVIGRGEAKAVFGDPQRDPA
ncbi:MAG: ATP-binding protein, partial [Deltaproteobacteria bacterium]|nr:ATP-binding protein [Deltaproteobacteria bacterium]